jgi:hypothetical protein
MFVIGGLAGYAGGLAFARNLPRRRMPIGARLVACFEETGLPTPRSSGSLLPAARLRLCGDGLP